MHTMMEFEPPLVGLIVSDRNHSFRMLTATREFVIDIATVELTAEVVACGNTSGCKIDKVKAFDLTPVPAPRVSLPLIRECYANLECKVVDTRFIAKYNFVVLEVVKAWIDPAKKIHHCDSGNFFAAGKRFALPSRAK